MTRADALKHPNWEMGNKITIDSASMMSKGLGVIEADGLFGIAADAIGVVIHPESIIHSLVQFNDGSIKAQLGLPDMRLPIQYAMGYPGRIYADFPRFDFADYSALTFYQPDLKKFRNLALAYQVLETGGNIPCALNAANEVAVEAFLNGMVSFIKMPEIIEKTIEKIEVNMTPAFGDLAETDKQARIIAKSFLQ